MTSILGYCIPRVIKMQIGIFKPNVKVFKLLYYQNNCDAIPTKFATTIIIFFTLGKYNPEG